MKREAKKRTGLSLSKQGFLFILLLGIFLQGCRTVAPPPETQQKESFREVGTAVKTVLENISQKEMESKDLKKVVRDIQTDPEAQAAVQSIADAMQNKKRMKYSPATGKRYAPSMEYCPETGVKLKWVE